MKQILYLMVLICCFMGCKKIEQAETIRFSRIEFKNETKLSQLPYILYDGKKRSINASFAVAHGDKTFTIYKTSGEKLIDTTLNVNGHQVYYLIQPDTTKPAILSTTAPPPVTPPGSGPLNGATAARPGYIKFKMNNAAFGGLPFDRLNVVMNLMTTGTDGKMISTPLTTLEDIGLDFNTSFYEVKRGDDRGEPGKLYSFSFINPNTGELIRNARGEIYRTGIVTFDKELFNLFLLEIYDYPVSDENAIEVNGIKYKVEADVIDKK